MIAEILKDHGAVGASAAMKATAIMRVVALSHRHIRAQVSRERAAGVVICSDGNGYYLPATADEVSRFVGRMEKGIRSHARALRAARRYLYSLKMAAMGQLPNIEPESLQREAGGIGGETSHEGEGHPLPDFPTKDAARADEGRNKERRP